MNKFHSDSGFTLLEMILSIFIFAVIMSILGSGIFTIQQSLRKVSNKSDELEKYQVLDRVFTSSIRNAVPFYWKDNNRNRRSVFSGDTNKVSFAYLHRIVGSDDGGIRFIQFYLEQDNLVAVYKKIPILPWDQSTLKSADKEILATEVRSLSFSYADVDNNGQIVWKRSWSNSIGNYDIPLAIQVAIEWKNGTKEYWLRRTAGSGQFESLGTRMRGRLQL
jgi:prepilin-type N-terminal cleavage/methylation domain-containing protein